MDIPPDFDRLTVSKVVSHALRWGEKKLLRANRTMTSILNSLLNSHSGRFAEKDANSEKTKGEIKKMLHDIRMGTLQHYKALEVEQFLELNIDHRFSKKEFLTLYKKITGRSLSKPTTPSPPARRLNLEEITVGIQKPRIDLTKPWKSADLAISTKNSSGRLLYTNKTIIDTVSPTIRQISAEDSRLKKTIDVEYTTIKEMLSVIHHCDTKYRGPYRVLHPALLHSMYRAASKKQLDIPMIRKWCVAQLLKQKSVDSWEVMTNLHITPKNYYRSSEEWREWIFREDEHLSYRRGDRIVVVTPCQHEAMIRSDLVLELIDIL